MQQNEFAVPTNNMSVVPDVPSESAMNMSYFVLISDACRVDLRLNGLSFGQGDDCSGKDFVEVDGIPFCGDGDVTSTREKTSLGNINQ